MRLAGTKIVSQRAHSKVKCSSCCCKGITRPQPGQVQDADSIGTAEEATADTNGIAGGGAVCTRESTMAAPHAGQVAFRPRYFSLTRIKRWHKEQETRTFLRTWSVYCLRAGSDEPDPDVCILGTSCPNTVIAGVGFGMSSLCPHSLQAALPPA